MPFVFPVEPVLLTILMAGNNTPNQPSIFGFLSKRFVKTIKCLFVLMCLANTETFSQSMTIMGIVRDSVTQEPLEGATVIVDYRKNISGTKTDKNGRFSIDVFSGSHVVTVRFVGYLPSKILLPDVKKNFKLTFELSKLSTQLEQVVVTSKGYDNTVRQPILGVNQINIKTLEKIPAALGEVDLLRGIQMLPGVSSVGEASNGVNIRGGTTDQNLILLDDTPIFNPTHMFGLFSLVPAEAVNNLDLYKGNVPARFGGRAASVLDITLKNPNLKELKLTGGVSLVSTRLMADIPIVKEKAGIFVATRGSFNDFLLPLASEDLEGIKTSFAEVAVKGFWRINPKNTVTAMGYLSYDFFKTSLLANLPNVVGVSTYYKHLTVNGMARWLHVVNDKLNIQTTAVLANYAPSIGTTEKTGNDVDLLSSIAQTQLKSNLNYQLTRHKIETGLLYTRYQIKPGTLEPNASPSVNYLTTPTENALELAWYADDEISVSKKLAVSFGLRYSQFLALGSATVRSYEAGQPRDEFSVISTKNYGEGEVTKSYGGFEPRIGLRYELSENSSLKMGYNLMRQYIQVVSNTTTPIPTSRWKTSDAHIKPQISNLASLGYYKSFTDNIYEISLEGYYRATENMIDYKPGADFLLQRYPETQLIQGQSRSYGLELMVSKKKGTLTGWVNYTYSRTENKADASTNNLDLVNGGDWYRANYDRPHSFNASIDLNVNTHNSFGFTFVYSTGRPYTEPVGFINYQNNFYPFYDERNNKRIPDYHRLDFAWNINNPSMKNKRWNGKWAFTVYNLYGRGNVYSVFFKTENNIVKANQLQIFAAPIPTLSYTFVFK
jgi:TonB dependent receptor/CarboxypepD_reg-like domain/TonB-dependent Receptor Plug Domain